MTHVKSLIALMVVGSTFLSSATASAGLIHRYSFDKETVKDSAGNVDGALKGKGATIANGKLALKNEANASGDSISHVAFSAPLFPKDSTSGSLVIWFTAKDVGQYSRLIDIGDSEGGEGRAFIYVTPRNADDQARAAVTATDVSGRIFVDNDRLDDDKPHMMAIVFDGTAKKLHVFIDGKEPKPAEDLGENTLDKVRQAHSYLGRSSFDADPGLSASIDEFRVYDNALKPDEITAIQKAGPDALPAATVQPAR